MSQTQVPEVCYLLAAVLSSGGALVAAIGYSPALGPLLLAASALCLGLGLVLASWGSQRRKENGYP